MKIRAINFSGTIDPAEVEKWQKRIKRVFNMMHCVQEEKLDYTVSLIQVDAYDWWGYVLDSTIHPPYAYAYAYFG